MSIKVKFTWSYVIIALLVAGLAIFIINGVNKSSDGFTSYREMAKDSVLASRVQANMLMVRMNVKDYLKTPIQKEIDEFEGYYKKTDVFVKKALKVIHKHSRAQKVKEVAQKLVTYRTHFYEVVEFYKERNKIVNNNLDVNGKKIEQLLSAVMNSAKKDKDLEGSLSAGESIRSLLLARLYTAKYLATNNMTHAKRVDKEFSNLQENLKVLRKEIQNHTRRKQLAQAIGLIETYKDGVKSIVMIIKQRNEIINNKLNVIGPDIAQLSTDIKLSIKKDQDTIGPRVADENDEIKNSAIFVGIAITLFVIFLSIFLVMNALVKPLALLEELTKDLSEGDGDLTKRLQVNGDDEIAVVSKYINLFIEKVRSTVDSVKQTSHENASISHELSTTALSVGGNVENAVVIVSEATTQAKSVQDKIIDAISDAQGSKGDIIKANKNLKIARDEIITLTSKVQESAQVEAELSQNMEDLSKDADEVKNVLVIISDIADQTNLLALNAAIEAARAGEHGRGFAVVADEVRKLAERTQKTLVEINATINVVVQSIGDASTQMNTNSNDIQNLANIAQGVEENINSTVAIVNEATIANDKTVKEFENTGKNVEVIVNKVQEVNELSSTNARSVEEIAAAAEHLNSLTNDLNSKLETFRT